MADTDPVYCACGRPAEQLTPTGLPVCLRCAKRLAKRILRHAKRTVTMTVPKGR